MSKNKFGIIIPQSKLGYISFDDLALIIAKARAEKMKKGDPSPDSRHEKLLLVKLHEAKKIPSTVRHFPDGSLLLSLRVEEAEKYCYSLS